MESKQPAVAKRPDKLSPREVVSWATLRAGPMDATAFLCSYRSFMSPSELLEDVLSRYEGFYIRGERERCSKIVAFFALWVKIGFVSDFRPRPALLERMRTWLELHADVPELVAIKAVFARKEGRLGLTMDIDTGTRLPVPSSGPVIMNHKFMDWDTDLIATHLSLISAEMYNKVQASEFIDLNWQKDNRDTLAPNLVALAARFNRLSFWVAASIVYQPEPPRTSVAVVKKWVTVAMALLKLHDYQTLMAVVAGLNHGAVQRLKVLWSTIKPKTMDSFNTLDALFNPLAGYRNYREHLARLVALGTKPIVPYMPCVLGDLAMQGEGNATLIDGMVNMAKIEMVGARVYEALRFQPAEYDIEQDRSLVMYFLSTELTLNEDDLYGESQRREPVGGGTIKADRASRKFFPKSMQLLSSAAPGRLIPRARANSVYSRDQVSRLSLAHPANGSGAGGNSAPATGLSPLAAAAAASSASAAASSSSSTSGAGAHGRPPRSTVSGLGMAKLQILSMHQSVANVKPSASSAAQRTRLARSESWPPKTMRSHDDLPMADAIMEARVAEAAATRKGSLETSSHTPPLSPAKKLSGIASQAPSGPSSPMTLRAAHGDSSESLPMRAGTLRDHSKSPPSLKVFDAAKLPSGPGPSSAALNRTSGGALPVASRASDRRSSMAIGSAVATALTFHSPLHSPKASPKASPMSSPKSSPMGSPKGGSAAVDALQALQRPARSWSTSDVGAWLQMIGLGIYAPSFRENQITGHDLVDLSDDDLADMGVTKIGHKKIILAATADLFGSGAAPLTPKAPTGSSPRKVAPVSRGPTPTSSSSSSSPAPVLVKSPRSLAGSPRVLSARHESLLFKFKHAGKIAVVEMPSATSFAELMDTAKRALGVVSVAALSYVDAHGEQVRIANDGELRAVLGTVMSANVSIVVT